MGPLEELLFLGTLMALGAFSIDVMLPALEATAHRYGTSPTAAQLVVGLYFLGFALGQLLWGPLMDALGRRKVLRGALFGFSLAALATVAAPGFSLLLAARFVQGFFAASFRIGVTASIRDRYRGEAMARRLSYALLVLMVAPVLAPALGVALLALGPWAPYALPAFLGLLALLWSGRFRETLPEEARRPLRLASLGKGPSSSLGTGGRGFTPWLWGASSASSTPTWRPRRSSTRPTSAFPTPPSPWPSGPRGSSSPGRTSLGPRSWPASASGRP